MRPRRQDRDTVGVEGWGRGGSISFLRLLERLGKRPKLPVGFRGGALKMQEWKMREHIAGVENAGVENAGATKYGKPSEKNTLKHQTKYGCRGFLA